ncbi:MULTISPECIES: pantoate--beta-alanine ligase [Hymenobacter]|uniref:Pantothenate synthetase n=1 Tax=Hymenobacter jejuensis TaxID=2502781 RepID=A0A5B8A070_9BACT|nr:MULTISPECIES: pantoate--beta-alanine ligase [Hymenobacter]MBC6991720.1 pantoate--beta-alanine ligase [Hymenobacter sp. BT491]QDA60045.1 pantoate--beta-alanine ligase [Hymenobacter jejuensis]
MEILQTAAELQALTETWRRNGQRIGLVPTMGALHEGHLQLVRAAAAQNDVVITSVFVNPTQFNNPEDFRLYPRLPEADAALLAPAGCTALFLPSVEQMYPQPTVLRFDFGPLERVMEGAHRPGHFNGVATVVSKLFHLARPHRAYFGQKDLQQVTIIRQLVADLSFDLELVAYSTIRESDGLAMSSRNRRLSTADRAVAPRLYEALQLGAEMVKQGQSPSSIRQAVQAQLASAEAIKLEYFEVADAQTLQSVEKAWTPGRAIALCLAAHLGDVRLIDNVIVDVA